MKKITFLLFAIFSLLLQTGYAQKYYTKNGKAYFVSKASLETIEATNNAATIIIDSKTGALATSLSVKGFVFEKGAEYQTKFNTHYLESGKYPDAGFKGSISNNADIKYTTDGTYTANISGKLTIHGVSKDISTKATITVKKSAVSASATFKIKLSDYGISVPASASKNISSTVEIRISAAKLDIAK